MKRQHEKKICILASLIASNLQLKILHLKCCKEAHKCQTQICTKGPFDSLLFIQGAGKEQASFIILYQFKLFFILHTPFTDRFYTHLHACRAQYVTVDFISNLFLLQEINSFPK